MLRERGRITQHTGGRSGTAVGICGRNLWSESVAEIFGRNLWSESLVGICGRNLWPESVAEIFGRNLWSESVVGADVLGVPPPARDVRQSCGRAALVAAVPPVRTPRAEGGAGTAATSAALPHDAARFHFGTGRTGKVATCCGNVAGSRSTQGGGRGRRSEPVVGICSRNLWSESVVGIFGRNLWPESVAGICGRNLWPKPVVGICGRGRRPRRPAPGAGRPAVMREGRACRGRSARADAPRRGRRGYGRDKRGPPA